MSLDKVENVRLSEDGQAVVIIDQTLLPDEVRYISLKTAEEMHDAIFSLRVRGAPAIGIFAAYSLYVLARGIKTDDYNVFSSKIAELSAYLNSSRPTAVNLETQLRRMETLVSKKRGERIEMILNNMRDEAEKIQLEDVEMCISISEHGLTLIRDGFGIMTQCNAGPLATSAYGTALGSILLGKERGMNFRAYTCETRPLLQGARLTAYELHNAGVDCTLICDNMASIVMKEGKIDAVFAGCDRVAKNGDVANKIGTSSLAILAKHYNIPFYIFCPSSTLDLNCATGADIEIELRAPEEISEMFYKQPVAPKGIKCYNPAFDVTDSSLITAIITEKGVFNYPYSF